MSVVDNALLVVFKDNFEETHVERVFRMNKDGDDLSGLLKQLIAATARDSSELKDWYETLLGNQIPLRLKECSCLIETEYRGEYVNIKTIRSGNDRDNGGGFFQSVETNPAQEERAANPEQPKRYLAVSDAAATFF